MRPLVTITLLLIVSLSFAQNVKVDSAKVEPQQEVIKDSTFYRVVRIDNYEYYGYIIEDDGRELLLQTKNIGKLYMRKSDVVKIEPVSEEIVLKMINDDGDDYGELRTEGVFSTRYYFTNNAFPVKKGEHYAMIHLFGPEIHFALSNKFSLGVISSWIGSPFMLAGKYSIHSDSLNHWSFGTILGSSGYLFNGRRAGGLHWLTYTRGTRDQNFSASLGLLYHNANTQETNLYSYENQDWYYGGLDNPFLVSNSVYNALTDQGYAYNWVEIGGTNVSFAYSIAGIIPVGEKASFIFDAMSFVYRPYQTEYLPTQVTVPVNGVNTTATIGQASYGQADYWNATVIFMPTMRFYTAIDKAFQITLGGVINFGENSVQSFPLPMVAWMRQF